MLFSSGSADRVREYRCHGGTSLATQAEDDYQADQCSYPGQEHRSLGIAKVQCPSETEPARNHQRVVFAVDIEQAAPPELVIVPVGQAGIPLTLEWLPVVPGQNHDGHSNCCQH